MTLWYREEERRHRRSETWGLKDFVPLVAQTTLPWSFQPPSSSHLHILTQLSSTITELILSVVKPSLLISGLVIITYASSSSCLFVLLAVLSSFPSSESRLYFTSSSGPQSSICAQLWYSGYWQHVRPTFDSFAHHWHISFVQRAKVPFSVPCFSSSFIHSESLTNSFLTWICILLLVCSSLDVSIYDYNDALLVTSVFSTIFRASLDGSMVLPFF